MLFLTPSLGGALRIPYQRLPFGGRVRFCMMVGVFGEAEDLAETRE